MWALVTLPVLQSAQPPSLAVEVTEAQALGIRRGHLLGDGNGEVPGGRRLFFASGMQCLRQCLVAMVMGRFVCVDTSVMCR